MAMLKKLLLCFLLAVFLLQASFVLALEINYPPVPGAETPNQIQQSLDDGTLNQKDAFPLYINYFLRFFYLLAISIVIAVVIYGGLLYLISGAKPAVLVIAKNWISRGFLGLVILICSYLVLGLINPQLLTFKIDHRVAPIISFEAVERPGDIVFLQNPSGSIIENTIKMLDETTSTKWGYVHKIEVPFLEIKDMLSNVIATTTALQDLFSECKCGTTKSHIKQDGLMFQCVGGMDNKDKKSWLKERLEGGIATCGTNCETCGPVGNKCDVIPDDGDIKTARKDLIELLAKLETQKVKLSSDQISLIEKTLELNTTNFLLANLLDVNFQGDFEAQKKALEAEGYTVSVERPENLPEPKMITMSPARIDTWISYTPKKSPVHPPNVLQENKEVEEESHRISLFSVLSQLSLEDIENMINQCFSSAFGEGSFMLDDEQFMETVKEALEKGVFGYLGNFTPDLASATIDDFCKNLGKKIGESAKTKMDGDAAVCQNGCLSNSTCQTECKAKCLVESSTEIGKCQRKCCQKECKTIPPNFFSNALNNLLTKDIKDQMFDGVKELYDKQLREFVFDKELNKILSDDMVDLLDKVLHGALKKSVKDQIPFLKENLEKKMLVVLPSFVSIPLYTIDCFLESHLKNLKKVIDNKIKDVIDDLTERLSGIISSNLTSYKRDNPDLFNEYLPLDDCLKAGGGYYNNGYYYDGYEHKCLKATPEDLNSRTFFNITVSSNTFPTNWGWGNRERICRDAGYDWYVTKEDHECQEHQQMIVINREDLLESDCLSMKGAGVYNGGYYFSPTGNGGQGSCLKATPENLNNEDNFFAMEGISYRFVSSWSFDTRKDICLDASYDWYAYKEGDEDYVEGEENGGCQKHHFTFRGAAGSFKEKLSALGKALLSGLFNLAEQLMFAMLETSAYTLTQYARVWVEDEIVAPIQPYLNQLSDFQKKLHKFLMSSVEDLLPQQIASYLSSNIDQIMADICKKSESGQPIVLYGEGAEDINMDKIEISADVGKHACHIHEEFHQSILYNLKEGSDFGSTTVALLNTKFYDFLSPWAQKYLNKSFAEIFFPEITNITDLIKGTPKEVLCGKLVKDYSPFAAYTGEPGTQSMADKCNQAQIKGTDETFGFLPYINTKSEFWKNLSPEQQMGYQTGCPFIWYACQNPLSNWNKGVGTIIAKIMRDECAEVDKNVGNVCNGVECDNCDIDALVTNGTINLNTGKELKNKCFSCDILVDESIGYSLFKYAIESNYGSTIPTGDRTGEIRAFQWLVVTFAPLPNRLLLGDIERLVKERGLKGMWEDNTPPPSPRDQALNSTDADDFKSFCQDFVSWFTGEGTTVYTILTGYPLGIMEYLKGDAYVGKNFLSRTPYQLLYSDLCPKIKNDFKKDFPDWTIESILSRERAKISGLAYSPESLKRFTTADGLRVLYNAPETEVSKNRKINYMSCLYLTYAPKTMLGLDQQLIAYVQPDSLQIMFHLINEKLDHKEDMPEFLRALLENYLYQEPAPVLNYVGNQIFLAGEQELGNLMATTSRFLDISVNTYINKGDMTVEIIKLIFRKAFSLTCGLNLYHEDCLLYKKIGWKKWKEIQAILSRKPVELIEHYIVYELIPSDITNADSIMDQIANGQDKIAGNEDDTVLGKPYIDTLGHNLPFGLGDTIYDTDLIIKDVGDWVDNGLANTQKVIQETSNKVLLEAPKAGFDWIVQTLGNLIGLNLGGKTADQMTGKCEPAKTSEEANESCNKENYVYKKETKECCSIGQGLVCVPLCREKGDTECEIQEGEEESGDDCCFDNCRKCRLTTQRESKENKCLRYPDDPGKEYFRSNIHIGAGEDSFDLCCWDREFKEGKDEEQDKCCVNIMDCIVDKFTFHLQMLGDMLSEGPPLNSLGE